MVLVNFLMLVLLWFFREPKFMPGWGELFKDKYVYFLSNLLWLGTKESKHSEGE